MKSDKRFGTAKTADCSYPPGPAAWSLPALSQPHRRPAPGSLGCSVGTPGPCQSGQACGRSAVLLILELYVTAESKCLIFIRSKYSGGFESCSCHFSYACEKVAYFRCCQGLCGRGRGVQRSAHLFLHEDERRAAPVCKECGLVACCQNTGRLRLTSW